MDTVRLPGVRGGIEPGRRGRAAALLGNAPEKLLGAALLTSGVLLVSLTSRLTWRFDDWDVLLFRPGWSAHSLLAPHYEHITVTQVVIYKILLAIFGMSSLVPFSVVSTFVFLLSTVLLFVYMRRRVGDWLALISATVVLFLGAAYEDLLWPIQILLFGSMACGLGMLLALEREDRIGDRLACVLLAASISFFSLGLAFAAGAAVDILQRRRSWRSRIYVVAIPIFLYGLWWLGWGHTAQNSLTLHDVGAAPLFMLDMMAAGVAAVFGLGGTTLVSTVQGSLVWGRPLLPVVLLLAGWRMHLLQRVPRWLWIVAAIGFATWFLAALGSQPGRPPDASRYQYATVVFIFLIAAELLRGVQVGQHARIAVCVIAAAALMGNLTQLFDSYKTRKLESNKERAALGAVEIARDRVPRVFKLPVSDPVSEAVFSQTLPYVKYRTEPAAAGSPSAAPSTAVFSIAASAYLKAVDDFGSPAYSPTQLATSSEPAREVADRVFAAALGIKLALTRAAALQSVGAQPSLIGPPDALVGSRAHCLSLDASAAVPPLLDLPPGGAVLVSGAGSGFEVRLRRFASTVVPVDLGNLPPNSGAVINIPTDQSAQPWKLSLTGSGRVDVCGHGRRG